MYRIKSAFCATALAFGLGLGASPALADTTQVDFELSCATCPVSMQPVPVVGSFTYDSSQTGVLSLSNLLSFDISLLVTDTTTPIGISATQTRDYNLADMLGFAAAVAANPSSGYLHFSWDATSLEFIEGYAGPGWANEASGVLHLIAAAIDTPLYSGFRLDRTPVFGSSSTQTVTLFNTVPGNPASSRSFTQQYDELVVSVVSVEAISAVPEPASVCLALAGLGVLCATANRRRARCRLKDKLRVQEAR